MKAYQELAQRCDAYIRDGRPHEAGRLLAKLRAARTPREWRLPLAKLCRRAGQLSLGLELLTRLVHPARHQPEATAPEKAEYGILLLRTGAVSEAIEWLNQVDTDLVPDALHFRAVWHFIQWDYQSAIAPLEEYLATSLSDDARLVGRTNLAFAHVECGHHARALDLLNENIDLAGRLGHWQLQRNNRAFRGQLHLQEGEFGKARRELKSALQIDAGSPANDQFLIVKLRLLLDALEKSDLKALDELRILATRRRDWEALREADLFRLDIHFVNTRFLHLLFGTPYPVFRERVLTRFGRGPDREIFVLGEKSAPRMDVATGEIENHPAHLRAGHQTHRLIEVLLRDFYQPLRIGGLFAGLFPQDHFDISSSPSRVHQVLRRTRQWIREERVPIRIHEADGFYALEIVGDFSFRIPLARRAPAPEDPQLQKLKRRFKNARSFTAREAAEYLELPKATATRFIKKAIESGHLARLGDSDRTAAYRIETVSDRDGRD